VIKGTIKSFDAYEGVEVANGIITGIVTKQDADYAINIMEESCQVPEPAQDCSYIGLVKSFLPMLFDLDLDKDGEKDAASICLFFTGKKGIITGYLE